ncbi:MAG TPA: NUDIX domain-containing protein [Anaerolineales bacterium]|nr:NUDIX domain-containing protein [Anaerolineales bacterium]HNQ95918.1 NUDIX domain-containing protein [Anaerolineales bacterium]HNS59919.1 NUDIX domain-containing protein [Anaerolineales bacterium]
MRTRAGIVLVEDNKVALIERHRAGLDYFVFPGGGVDDGESPEQAAVREAMEELGVEVVIKQKVAEIHFDTSVQIYFLVERVGGEFGTGMGDEFTDSDPRDPSEGIYAAVWMPIGELSWREKVYPAPLAKLVLQSETDGWGNEAVVIVEKIA